jgi:hypothetical protein
MDLPFQLETDLEKQIYADPAWQQGAFNAWRMGALKGQWDKAEARAKRLVARFGLSLPPYVLFEKLKRLLLAR